MCIRDSHSHHAYSGSCRTARRSHWHHPWRQTDCRRHFGRIARPCRAQWLDAGRCVSGTHARHAGAGARGVSAAPGTFLWLIAHDLRLSGRRFRAMFRSMSIAKIVLVMCSALGAFHLLAWPFAIWIRDAEETGDPWLFLMLASAVLFVIPWVVSQALTSACLLYTSRCV